MFFLKKLITILYFFSYTLSICFGTEFYEIDTPYRKDLNRNYQYDINFLENNDEKQLDTDNIRKIYIENANNITSIQKDTERKLIADKEEAEKSNRQKFLESKNEGKADTSVEQKNKPQKSWIEDWIPETSTKPMELLGAYINFKIWLMYPMSSNISATEKKRVNGNTATIDLFTGKVLFKFFPAFSVSIGNDKFEWFRWDIELGYFPLLANNNGDVQSSVAMSGYTFNIAKKELSSHLLLLNLNVAVQHAYFNKSFVIFFGFGIGVGYAFSASNTLSSDFVMPVVNLSLGCTFMLSKKMKMNIAYTFMYSTMNIPSKYSFDRINQYGNTDNNQAILGGSLKFNKIFINGINFGFQFYTA